MRPRSEVRLAEAREALIDSRRIKHAQIKIDRLAEPPSEMRVIAKIIERQWMDQDAKTRRDKRRLYSGDQRRLKVDFELRDRARPDLVIAKLADKQDPAERIVAVGGA